MSEPVPPAEAQPRAAPPGFARAGTVLVVQPDEFRVLMLRRQTNLRVLGGFWVFPGGTVDAGDRSHGTDQAADRAADQAAGVLADAAAAACRELHEEAGLILRPSDLVHWAHWITPSGVPRRFDTHFFLAAAPPGQEPRLAVAEASELRWVTQPKWRAAVTTPGFPLTPPTLLVLRELADALSHHGSLGALLACSRDRRVSTVLPKLVLGTVVLPWDPEYERLPGDGIAWDAADIAARAGWPSRLPTALGTAIVAGAHTAPSL
jgi:8-oxo-dGTP pyrophosphatase MutT (NUDIX family)